MTVEFGSTYSVGVVVFALALCFCKSLLEGVLAAVRLSRECKLCPECMCLELCSQSSWLAALKYVKAVLLCFNVAQPVLMLLAAPLRAWVSGARPVSHVTFLAVRGNATAWELQPTSVDLLFVTVPFSMLASATTAMWIHLAEQGVFLDDPTWDAALFERDERVWLYETLYYYELTAMCFALAVAASRPRSATESMYMSTTIAALLIFFASAARYETRSQAATCSSTTALALLCAILTSFTYAVDGSCALPVASGAALDIVAFGVAAVHAVAAGQFSAGAIILARTLASNVCSGVLIATLAGGLTSGCV